MKDYLEICCTPVEEDSQQVGTPNYNPVMARKECRAFLHQLRRQFGPEPFGAQLKIKSNPHDFGYYLEVVCYFDDENEKAREYAFTLEGETPLNWDHEAKVELGLVPGALIS